MKIYGIQMDIQWEDKPANFAHVRQRLAAARPEAGSLVVLPEMFATGFSMDASGIAEENGGRTEGFLQLMAQDFGIWIVAGVAGRIETGQFANRAVTLNPQGEVVSRYSKMQPYCLAGEDKAFAAGPEPVVFDWNGVKVSPFVCYDLRFPEIQRTAVLAGAEVMVFIANWLDARLHHWVKLLTARAIENQTCVIGVNRLGKDPLSTYSGRTLIVNHHGEVLADAGAEAITISAVLDIQDLRAYRERFPAIKDIRADYRTRLA